MALAGYVPNPAGGRGLSYVIRRRTAPLWPIVTAFPFKISIARARLNWVCELWKCLPSSNFHKYPPKCLARFFSPSSILVLYRMYCIATSERTYSSRTVAVGSYFVGDATRRDIRPMSEIAPSNGNYVSFNSYRIYRRKSGACLLPFWGNRYEICKRVPKLVW